MAVGEEFYSSYIANYILNAFLCCTAILLNSITIHAIRNTSLLPKTLKTLLLSLAVSDLGVGLLVHPLYTAVLVMEPKQNSESNPAYKATFKVLLFPANLFAFASFFGIIALGADRFMAIRLHLRYQELVTYKRVVGAVISAWLFSALLSLVRFWTPQEIIYVIFAIIHAACLITSAFLTCKIYLAVRRHANQIHALVRQVSFNVEIAKVEGLRKSAVAVLYVYAALLVCYLPNICLLWTVAISSSKPRILHIVIQRYTVTLLFLNSSLNPLIYCWKMRHIRHSVMNILRNAFSC